MEHIMNLRPKPFQRMKEGHKSIELRLYDEKSGQIAVGDTIQLVNAEDEQDIIRTEVK